jgi:hypothetical protein
MDGKGIEMRLAEKKAIRQLAIELLDTENGMSVIAFNLLAELLRLTGSEDILHAVNDAENNPYIGEDDAEDFRREISKWEEAQTAAMDVGPDLPPHEPVENDALQDLIAKTKDQE